MLPKSYIRFRKNPPTPKERPPRNFFDVFYDATIGKIIARDSFGAAIEFEGSGGASSTADLTTSDGTAVAAAGKLGEYFEDAKTSGSAVNIDGGVVTVFQIALTPGDWDVQAHLHLRLTAASLSTITSKIQTTPPGVLTIGSDSVRENYDTTTATGDRAQAHVSRRVLVASATTVYLNANANISAGTVIGFGFMSARRVR